MGLQAVGDLDLLDLVAEGLLDEFEQRAALGFVLLFLLAAEFKIAVHNGAEGLFVVVHQGLQGEFVRFAREVEDLVVLVLQKLGLRQLVHRRDALAGGIVDALLIFFHARDVFLERRELLLRGGVEHQQLLERVLARLAAVAHDAEAELAAEVRVELLVALAVVFEELFKVGAHLLFKVLADDLELAVVLQELAGNVEAQIRRIDHAAHKAQIVGQERVALVHDENARAVELQALLVAFRVEVERARRRHEQQRLIGNAALGGDGDRALGLVEFARQLRIELVVLLVRHLAALALPERHHGVDGLERFDGLKLGLFGVAALLDLLLGHHHADGVADVVGKLLDERVQAVGLEILAVVLLIRVGLDVHDDLGADRILVALGHGVAVRAGGLPAVGLLFAVLLRENGDLIGDHEGGVESYAELADDVDIGLLLVLFLRLLAELIGTGGGDHAEVVFKLFFTHADAVIGNGQRAVFLVDRHGDSEIAAVHADLVIRQRNIAELVDGVAGVGDDLAQEDLLMCINGVYHQVEQTLRLCFELFLCHKSIPLLL